jgi:hypothetical protein
MVYLRRAYEKANQLYGPRRGRRDDVPLEVYHELDDLYRLVNGLTQVVGTSRESLSALGSGGLNAQPSTPDEKQAPVFENIFVPGYVLFSETPETASDPAYSQSYLTPYPTILNRVFLIVTVAAASQSRGILEATANGNSIVAQSGIGNFTVVNNEPIEVTNRLRIDVIGKLWATGTEFIFGFNRAVGESNTNVKAVLDMTQRVPKR